MSQILTDLSRRPGVLLVTLNRPERHNALGKPLLAEFEQAIDAASRSASVRCIVVTGAGERAFCAGADIREQEGFSPDDAYAHMLYGQRLFDRLAALSQPVFAAINGFALGGGLELALACDARFASDSAQLGFPEVTLASLPGWGGTQRLPRLIGRSAAKLMAMSGERVGASEALRVGLVDGVYTVDELLPSVLDLAATVAAREPEAVRAIKRVIDQGLDLPWQEALDAEARNVAALWGSPPQKRAQAAFFGRPSARTASSRAADDGV
ncbi:MAG: enoyl-CoA hydratase/isomerase family protein [Burkholderiales bacterium]|nr:enoyl-CoA hydratase/isomerase family protein [Burkholderiales bacterium]